ncbi:trypsin-like peptidase domain-containing protein [Candidatus Woesearchaeota archaeon]|jgi:hypothetical protein|nr:trypsin-like peptidase domain-containing protein [Candidatus Woesearchaeota archaeon]
MGKGKDNRFDYKPVSVEELPVDDPLARSIALLADLDRQGIVSADPIKKRKKRKKQKKPSVKPNFDYSPVDLVAPVDEIQFGYRPPVQEPDHMRPKPVRRSKPLPRRSKPVIVPKPVYAPKPVVREAKSVGKGASRVGNFLNATAATLGSLALIFLGANMLTGGDSTRKLAYMWNHLSSHSAPQVPAPEPNHTPNPVPNKVPDLERRLEHPTTLPFFNPYGLDLKVSANPELENASIKLPKEFTDTFSIYSDVVHNLVFYQCGSFGNATATGIFINPQQVLTAQHVVTKKDDEKKLAGCEVEHLNNRLKIAGGSYSFDWNKDLAVLTLPQSVSGIKRLKLYEGKINAGMKVALISSRMTGNHKPNVEIRYGSVYADSGKFNSHKFLIDVPGYHGNSGGVVVDMGTGDIMGVISQCVLDRTAKGYDHNKPCVKDVAVGTKVSPVSWLNVSKVGSFVEPPKGSGIYTTKIPSITDYENGTCYLDSSGAPQCKAFHWGSKLFYAPSLTQKSVKYAGTKSRVLNGRSRRIVKFGNGKTAMF